MRNKRLLTLLGLIAFVVLIATGSWIAGANIQSPAEAAARTAAPSPSPILVPVELRVLSTNIVTRGSARYGFPQTISLVPSLLKTNPSIVTTLPERGKQFEEGDVLLTSSGRPVFILEGEIPVFRDLNLGTKGQDVKQLEQALERLGFTLGTIDGIYDIQTAEAIAKWYASTGFEAYGPSKQELDNLKALEESVQFALNDKRLTEEELGLAKLKVQTAQAKVDELKKNVTTFEKLEAMVQLQTALNLQTASERNFQIETAHEKNLIVEFENLRLKIGIHLPADEFVFLASLPLRIEKLLVTAGESAAGNVLEVTNNQLSIDATLPLEEAPLVRIGMPVRIDEPTLGIKAIGIVERIAEGPGTDGADGFHVYFETKVTESSNTLEGFSLRLTLPIESTGGEVLAVPISALSLAADGSSRIQVNRDGVLYDLVVQPGLAADGYVELSSVEGSLAPGDLVLIGYEVQQ